MSSRSTTLALIAWAVGISLFLGFVGAAVLTALAPRTVAFAAELACDGTMNHSSTAYQYKPGQRGTLQEWTCTAASGETTRIVGPTYLYASLTFSAGSFVLLGVLVTIARLVRRRPNTTRRGSGSP